MEPNYTELLEQEYGQDKVALDMIQWHRKELHETDKEIYEFLESFY